MNPSLVEICLDSNFIGVKGKDALTAGTPDSFLVSTSLSGRCWYGGLILFPLQGCTIMPAKASSSLAWPATCAQVCSTSFMSLW